MIRKVTLLLVAPIILAAVSAAQSTYEEQVVRNTYAAFVASCGQHGRPAPVIEITHVQSGTIESIASRRWDTRFTLPDDGKVLVGQTEQHYEDSTDHVGWREIHLRWAANDSYTPELVSLFQSVSVKQAIAQLSDNWTVPATYTRYATFDVTVTYQGRTVKYTASFFLGKDSHGNEVVSPQDAVITGQLLWDAIKSRPRDLTAKQ